MMSFSHYGSHLCTTLPWGGRESIQPGWVLHHIPAEAGSDTHKGCRPGTRPCRSGMEHRSWPRPPPVRPGHHTDIASPASARGTAVCSSMGHRPWVQRPPPVRPGHCHTHGASRSHSAQASRLTPRPRPSPPGSPRPCPASQPPSPNKYDHDGDDDGADDAKSVYGVGADADGADEWMMV